MSWIREPDAEALPGYRLIKPLGMGGYGEVWECEAPGGIRKAIKFLFGNLSGDTEDPRAKQEFRALQRVKDVRHPFVLSIERIDVVNNEVVLVMELADQNLHDVLQHYRREGLAGIPRDKLLKYLTEAAEGLDFLADKFHVLHLDVKPRNLFLLSDHIKVADFGLAKHLDRQSSRGLMGGMSPMYAAPETFSSKISRHTDQYSLAIVYVELLTGSRPFTGKNIQDLAVQHTSVEPNLSLVPPEERRVLLRALSKDPEKRYPNCQTFVQELLKLNPPKVAPTGPVEIDDAESQPTQVVVADPRGKIAASIPPANHAPQVEEEIPSARPVDVGIFRPTIVLGLGGFGKIAVQELKNRLTDRLGDLKLVPMFRFLTTDCDPKHSAIGTKNTHSDTVTVAEDFLKMPLQPLTQYRRGVLDQLADWLPREKLHSIPRNLDPNGDRSLGRLAFGENYLKFSARIKKEIEIAIHPESITRSTSHTGYPLRSPSVRVFVIAAAGGASSGALPDVGYSIKKVLAQLKQPLGDLHLCLFCGSPADPTTPSEELSNIYATLTELNHYSDGSVVFRAAYGGPDGAKLETSGAPFGSVYLLQTEGRSPETPHECAGKLASYLCNDLTTELGDYLDRSRQEERGFRSFGTAGVWFPRGLLLRNAARLTLDRLVSIWQAGTGAVPKYVESTVGKLLADPEFQFASVANQVLQAVQTLEGEPFNIWQNLQRKQEDKIPSGDGAALVWARETFDVAISFLGGKGSLDPSEAARTGKLTRLFTHATNEVTTRWLKRLTAEATAFSNLPGKRLANSEAAFSRLAEVCERLATEAERRAEESARQCEIAIAEARGALELCIRGGGFRLFGGRDGKNMRTLLSTLEVFAKKRIIQESHESAAKVFKKVQLGLEDKIRELSICRQRLTSLRNLLVIPEDAKVQTSKIAGLEVVLPDGDNDLQNSAKRFANEIAPENLTRLDDVLQNLILANHGGLIAICQRPGEVMPELLDPLIDQAASFLGTLLPARDITELQHTNDWYALVRHLQQKATPQVVGALEHDDKYMLVPDGMGGEAVLQHSGVLISAVNVISIPKLGEVTFCREQTLTVREVRELVKYCREPYQGVYRHPARSPHARFDVLEWVPLDV